ncbi:hypothetical protein C8F01DRAFT_1132470, partial [Mycena amicta]
MVNPTPSPTPRLASGATLTVPSGGMLVHLHGPGPLILNLNFAHTSPPRHQSRQRMNPATPSPKRQAHDVGLGHRLGRKTPSRPRPYPTHGSRPPMDDWPCQSDAIAAADSDSRGPSDKSSVTWTDSTFGSPPRLSMYRQLMPIMGPSHPPRTNGVAYYLNGHYLGTLHGEDIEGELEVEEEHDNDEQEHVARVKKEVVC